MLTKLKRHIYKWLELRRFSKILRKKGGYIRGALKLNLQGKVLIGEKVIINGEGIDVYPYSKIDVRKSGILSIGNNTGISQTSIVCKESITIGSYVNIGAGCLIIDSNFHSTDWQVRMDALADMEAAKNSPVVISDHVFIGARSIICKGVTIGEKSIIAAGSVVVNDIPKNCIAGGNPCKVINFLNK